MDSGTRSRYPKAEVNAGQKHGYIGADVDIFDPETGKVVGHGSKVAQGGDDDSPAGVTGTIQSDDAASDAPAPAGGRARRR